MPKNPSTFVFTVGIDSFLTVVAFTTGTNTTPQLLKALESHKIEPEKLVTHYFKLSEIEKAYEVFGKAADHHAIKVIIENDISES